MLSLQKKIHKLNHILHPKKKIEKAQVQVSHSLCITKTKHETVLFVTKHPLPPTPLFLYVPYGMGKRYRERIRGVVLSGLNIFTDAFLLSEISSNRDMNRVGVLSFYLLPVFSLISSDSSLSLFFAHSLGLFLLFSISLSQSISHLLPAQPEEKRWEGIVAYFSSLP